MNRLILANPPLSAAKARLCSWLMFSLLDGEAQFKGAGLFFLSHITLSLACCVSFCYLGRRTKYKKPSCFIQINVHYHKYLLLSAYRKLVTSAVHAWLLWPDKTGKGGRREQRGDVERDATWENELMRHKLCDSIAVCLTAAPPAWLPNYMSLIRLMMHVSKCGNECMHVSMKQGGGQVYAGLTF